MKSSLYSLAGAASTALAATHGFNYASQGNTQSTFESQFTTAQGLEGTSGWSSARLYTMIQDSTTNTVISAIPAAIATNTTLLLGLWASEDQATFDNEITALTNAISQYGSSFSDLVVGISVGSEDLYRISPTGIAANSGAGQSPDVLVDYIGQVRSAIAGTVLANAPVGHVDTWNVYTNTSNAAVISACDFLGLDEYPYYQNTDVNDVNNGSYLFFAAYDKVVAVAEGKPIYITETGWPVSGPTENLAVPSTANAEIYWQSVACELLERNIDTWWYILNDAGSSPSFGVETSGTTPLYNLTCPSVATSSSAVSTSSVASATSPTSAATSTTVSVTAAHPTSDYVSTTVGSSQVSAASSAVASAVADAASAGSSASVGSSDIATAVVPVTTSASTMVAENGQTQTVYSTTLITITSCGSAVTDCPASSMATVVSSVAAAVSSASASSVLASVAPSVTSAAASTVVPSGTASATGCPANLDGAYQFPHLIVPINSSSTTTAYGTSYDGTITPQVSTIFNFDIPESYANKTCSTVFLFPELDQLETSSYTFNGKGGFTIAVLNGVANEQTTYANAPAVAKQIGSVDSLQAGNSYTLSMDSCTAGQTVSFEITSMDGLDLTYFEDYNPSPLGLYVRAC